MGGALAVGSATVPLGMRQDKGENCDGPGVVGLVMTDVDKEGAKSKGMLAKGILLNTVYAHPERRERRMQPGLSQFSFWQTIHRCTMQRQIDK